MLESIHIITINTEATRKGNRSNEFERESKNQGSIFFHGPAVFSFFFTGEWRCMEKNSFWNYQWKPVGRAQKSIVYDRGSFDVHDLPNRPRIGGRFVEYNFEITHTSWPSVVNCECKPCYSFAQQKWPFLCACLCSKHDVHLDHLTVQVNVSRSNNPAFHQIIPSVIP